MIEQLKCSLLFSLSVIINNSHMWEELTLDSITVHHCLVSIYETAILATSTVCI